MSLRVMNLGLPKTGTTSLAHALKLVGYKVADHRIRRKQTDQAHLHDAFVADLLYAAYFETGDPTAHLGPFDAITEASVLRGGRSIWPQTDFALIDAIRRAHPDVKFIATRRNSWDVSQSMLAWSDLGVARLPQSTIPGLPEGYGETTMERRQWIDGHYAFLECIFKGDPNYLEIDVADAHAQQRIGDHIGTPLTWWGVQNANLGREKAG